MIEPPTSASRRSMRFTRTRYATLLFVATGLLCASCRSEQTARHSGPIRVVTSMHAIALVIRGVVGKSAEVTVLLTDAQSPHSYHARPSDIGRAEDADVLLLAAPEIDGWADELAMTRPSYLSALLTGVDRTQYEQSGNPHFWTDPTLVSRLAPTLADALCETRPESCDAFRGESLRFRRMLATLDSTVRENLEPLNGRCIVAAQPFFDYFFERYDVPVVATLEPVPGAEATPARMVEALRSAASHECVGIVVNATLPDAAARVFSAESELPLVHLDPTGTGGRESYRDWMLANVDSLVRLAGEYHD